MQSFFCHFCFDITFCQFCNHRFQMFLLYILQHNISTSNGCCHHKCTCFYTVWYHFMCGTMQLFNTFYHNGICAISLYICPHFHQKFCQIANFRFCRCIFNHCCSFCQYCCHHDIFRCTYTWKIQINIFSF